MKESSATQSPQMSVLSQEERPYINFILRDVGGFQCSDDVYVDTGNFRDKR